MEAGKQKMIIEGLDKVSVIPYRDIVYCKADGNYCTLFTKSEHLTFCKRIGILERELNDSIFIRISQSLLINKNYLKHIHKKDKKVELIEGILLPYSMNIITLISFLIAENEKEEENNNIPAQE